MDTRQVAIQRAMADEIGARLGRMHKSQAWLQREAGISASAWTRYFTNPSRDIKLSVMLAIADTLGMTAGDLVRLAEQDAYSSHSS